MERKCDNCTDGKENYPFNPSDRCKHCDELYFWRPGNKAILQLIEEVANLKEQLAEANRKIEILIMS